MTKILNNTLSLSASIEQYSPPRQESSSSWEDHTHSKTNVIVCKLQASQKTKLPTEAVGQNPDQRIVTYTLTAHTDQPGGSLIFQSEIFIPGEHHILCPVNYTKIFIRLVSNLVGLDESICLENGKATVFTNKLFSEDSSKSKAKSHNGETAKVPNSKKKGRKKASDIEDYKANKVGHPTISERERYMVKDIHDIRICTKPLQKKSFSTTMPLSHNTSPYSNSNSAKRIRLDRFSATAAVTPSPLPPPTVRETTTPESSNLWDLCEQSFDGLGRETNSFVQPSHPQGKMLAKNSSWKDGKRHSSWQTQKKQQGKLQQDAYGSQKENKAMALPLGHATGAARFGTESQVAHRTTPLRPLTR